MTLAEKVGMDTLNKEIRKRSIFYEQIAGKENKERTRIKTCESFQTVIYCL